MKSDETIEIRDYKPADKTACLALFDSNVPRYFDASERSMFEDFLTRQDNAYFVMENRNQICGCGGYAREDRGQARFTWGMVSNRLHGKGLGRLLAEYRLDAIITSGDFQEIELFTTPTIAAFFEKFGFAQERLEKDGFAPGMDKVQMIKWLNMTD